MTCRGCARALASLLLSGLALLGGTAEGAPQKPVLLAVVGHGADAGRLAGARLGAEIAAQAAERRGPLAGGVQIEVFDDGGTPAGLKKALTRLRARKPIAVVALPAADLEDRYAKAARRLAVPWITLTGRSPDPVRAPEYLLHLGPTPVGQAIAVADGMTAPLAARRVACVHEPTRLGLQLAAGFGRNLSARIKLAGIREWGLESGPASLRALKALEVEWIYVAMNGAHLQRFVRTLAASDWRPRLVFADGARDASLLEVAAGCLEGCVFLDGPDPEMHGRMGEALVDAVERAGAPLEVSTVRSYEGVRRLLAAVVAAGSTKLKHVLVEFKPNEARPGTLGALAFEGHGAVRLFAFSWWRVQKGRFEVWPGGLLPTPGCGPPIGFGHPRTARLNPRGKLGYLTWGGPDKRTIEQDLLAIGLSTGGKDRDLDAIVRREIQGRAIRIANRLFRREPDGTPIPGWSWGMAFTTEEPAEDVKRGRLWPAVCAGDHAAAGGQAFGTWVAVYTTFLKRTMYITRKLDPVISSADRPLLDGTYRWGEDRAANFRADKIRCLMDGFASAMGLTLSHEYGHLCGCGHDTEHETSIMNVVAGAGASWEDAVWIPKHQKSVTTSLGIEPLLKDDDGERFK